MNTFVRRDLYFGIFEYHAHDDGPAWLSVPEPRPETLPCPETGRRLRISTLEASAAICPACAARGQGGFVSFANDLRLAYACPRCHELVWLAGV